MTDSAPIRLLLIQLRRNRKGETVREGRIVDGETIAIGRASDQEIHLADPRVALSHARIRQRSFGTFVLESEGPDLRINGTFSKNADLVVGMEIEIGSFRMIVEPHAGDGYPPHDLALSLERVQAPSDADAPSQRHVLPMSLAATRFGMRRPAMLIAGLIGFVFLVLPALHAVSPAARARMKKIGVNPSVAWNAGPVSSFHRSIEGDCEACHAKPFSTVQDRECFRCHGTVGEHIGEAALRLATTGGARCADCHREHRGVRSLADVDGQACVECHATLATKHPGAGLHDIVGLGSGHPDFILPSVSATSGGLRFSHATHLSSEGVPSPLAPVGSDGRVLMTCADCHELEVGRRFYQPVSMEKHCAGCHRMDIEPGVSTRQAPHGSVTRVLTSVREYYAGVALGVTPMARADSPSASAKWVDDASAKAVGELFEKRACRDCHQVDRAATAAGDPAGIRGVAWQVRPVVQTSRWIAGSEFEHSSHASWECTRCHAAATSNAAFDVLIPPMATCRECHASEPATGMVTSDCESCHAYHGHPRVDP